MQIYRLMKMATLSYLHGRYAATDFHNHVNFFGRLLFHTSEVCLEFKTNCKQFLIN